METIILTIILQVSVCYIFFRIGSKYVYKKLLNGATWSLNGNPQIKVNVDERQGKYTIKIYEPKNVTILK